MEVTKEIVEALAGLFRGRADAYGSIEVDAIKSQ